MSRTDIITITTSSRSVYELNRTDRTIRRLGGGEAPTPRQGPDGEWKKLAAECRPVIGQSMLLVWGIEPNGSMLRLKSTVTSPVVSIVSRVHVAS